MGVIVFNNISSKTLGIEVETFPTYDVPEKEYEVISVPGRNGDLLIEGNRYKNVSRSYLVSMATYDRVSYTNKMREISEWLHSASGYARLEDSYEPDFFRYAYYKDPINIANIYNEAGRATLKFECKPQKYLRSGEYPVAFTVAGSIQNETKFDALPIITVTMNNVAGSVSIGNYAFDIEAGAGNTITVDSELQDAYQGVVNKNQYLVLNGGEFPKLVPGANAISFSGGVTSVEVIPRWWTV